MVEEREALKEIRKKILEKYGFEEEDEFGLHVKHNVSKSTVISIKIDPQKIIDFRNLMQTIMRKEDYQTYIGLF